jgi:hypothetical protein
MAAATPIRIAIDELDANLTVLKAEIAEGHHVDLVRGDAVIAEVRVKPVIEWNARHRRETVEEIMARLKKDFPDGPVSYDSTEIIREDRDSRG